MYIYENVTVQIEGMETEQRSMHVLHGDTS